VRPWIALFNSRKPRQLKTEDRWLVALRQVLPGLARRPVTLAASRGTISYDLTACFAQDRGLPLVLITTEPMAGRPEQAGWVGACADHLWSRGGPEGLLTCRVSAVACPKAGCQRCRDRLLAHLADVHLLLEIRDRGNLLETLQEQQRHRPKPQWVLEVTGESPASRGNLALMREFPLWGHPVALPPPASATAKANPQSGPRCSGPHQKVLPAAKSVGAIDWGRYLFHYTRSCPGPWPGQSYQDYLVELLEGSPTCGHGVLDTLLRVLTEGRIRGSHRLVRGVQAVVSWTSRPPRELAQVRRWNRALMRWTFEPYGLAVNRHELRRAGAKPAIYGSAAVFANLPIEERFRFQLQGSGGVWRLEREWRLAGDLRLRPEMDVLVMVPDAAAAEDLTRSGVCAHPIVVVGV
jgi:hypothetical protein